MLTIGIDPDLHDLAVGIWKDGQPHSAYVIHVPRKKGVIQHEAVVEMICAMDEALFGIEDIEPQPLRIAVEAQTLQRQGLKQHKRPQDIVILGNVAGAVLMASRYFFPEAKLLFCTPEQWKGPIPKAVMQARMYYDLGWGYEMVGRDEENGKTGSYARPLRPPPAFVSISSGQWKHVGDALLLARWAHEKVSCT